MKKHTIIACKDGVRERWALASREVGAGPPEWVQLLPNGKFSPPGKKAFLVDAKARSLIMANWATRTNDAVLDYEHQTLTGQKAPAAGWIKDLSDKGDGETGGIWGKVDWTDTAKAHLAAREYRYLSPVIMISKSDGRAVEFVNAALTNMPAIDGMVPVVNKEGAGSPEEEEDVMLEWLRKSLGLSDTATEAEVQAACKAKFGLASALTAALALKADATEEDAKAVVEALKAPRVPKKVTAALGLDESANANRCEGAILALKSGSASVSIEEFRALQEKVAGKDAETAVEQALKDGKVTPATREWALGYAKDNPEGFAEYCKKAPPVVSTRELGAGGGGQGGGGRLDDTSAAVCKMFGNKPEDVAAAKKAAGMED